MNRMLPNGDAFVDVTRASVESGEEKLMLTKAYYFPKDYCCSKCHKPLESWTTTITNEYDDEGYFWRSFCPDCARELGLLDKATVSQKDLCNVYFSHEIAEGYAD